MKIPSIKYLTDEAINSAKRFPLTLLSALVGVIVAVYLVEFESEIENKLPLVNLLLTSALGLVLFFSITIFKEKGQKANLPFWLPNLVGTAILVLIYFTLPSTDDTTNISQPYIRYTIYNVVVHLLVSFVPFISTGEINGFWQYNKMLFLRFCLSILYSGFLYIGLVLALVSLNLLFDADIEEERFFQLFIIVLGLFNTWFFVSGVDRDLDSLEKKVEYPKGLKTFTQFVLLPLLILYLAILYAYVAKIVGLWDWPRGIVSYLIVCVAVLGILTFLLIYPFGKNEAKHWIAKFSRIYYYTLLPLTIVLFVAIGIRIGDYGLTVNRYLIVELGTWLTFVSLYFIIGNKNIKVIPMSLSGIILLTSFGPWGMFGMSERSQVNRLKTILTEKGILIDQSIVNEPGLELGKDDFFILEEKNKNAALLTDSLQNEVYSILDYLDDHHGFDRIDDWYRQDPDSVMKVLEDSSKFSYYSNQAQIRMELMGLEYQYKYDYETSQSNLMNYYVESDDTEIVSVTGYDYLLDINYYGYESVEEVHTIDGQRLTFSKTDSLRFELVLASSDTIVFEFNALVDKLKNRYGGKSFNTVHTQELILMGSGDKMEAKILLNQLNISSGDSVEVTNFSGRMLIKMLKD